MTLNQAFAKIADVAEQGRKMSHPGAPINPEMRYLCERCLQEIVRTACKHLADAPTTFGASSIVDLEREA